MYIPTNIPRATQPPDTTETPEQERQRRIRESLVYGKRELAGRPLSAEEQHAVARMQAKLQTQAPPDQKAQGKGGSAREQTNQNAANPGAGRAATRTNGAAEQRAHADSSQQQARLAASRQAQQRLDSGRSQGELAERMQARQGERTHQERAQADRQTQVHARTMQQAGAKQAKQATQAAQTAHARQAAQAARTERQNQDGASLQAQDRRTELEQRGSDAAQRARNTQDRQRHEQHQHRSAASANRVLEQQVHKCLQQSMRRMLEEAGRTPGQGDSAYLDAIAERLQVLEQAIRKEAQQQRLHASAAASSAQATQAMRDKLEFFQGFCQSISEPAPAKQKLMAQLDSLAAVLEQRAQAAQAASKDAQAAKQVWKSYQDSLQELATSLAQAQSGLLRTELQRHQQRLAQVADEFKALSKFQLQRKCEEEQQVGNSLQLLAQLCSTLQEGSALQLQVRKILDTQRQRLREIHDQRRESHREVLSRGEALLGKAEEERKKKSLVEVNVEKL